MRIKAVYLCGGNPKCFGNPGCGLCGRGECYATTDIQCARNKVTLLNHGSESGDRLWKMVMLPLIEVDEDKYACNTQNEALKEENDELKAELYEFQKKLGTVEDVDTEADEE